MPEPTTARLAEASVVSTEAIAPAYALTRLSCPQIAGSIEPGQFVNIAVPGNAQELLRVPMSYSAADPHAGTLDIAYRVVGDGTRRLAALPAGTRLSIEGPSGHGWRFHEGTERALCVGGGSGMAPAAAAAARLLELGAVVDVVEGAQTAAQIVLEADLRALGVRTFEVTTDDGTRGIRGFASAAVEKLLAAHSYDAVYVCGPRPMMAGIARLARDAQVECQVSMESGMACGIGVCGTCPIDGVHGKLGVCVHGPVFDAEEVAW